MRFVQHDTLMIITDVEFATNLALKLHSHDARIHPLDQDFATTIQKTEDKMHFTEKIIEGHKRTLTCNNAVKRYAIRLVYGKQILDMFHCNMDPSVFQLISGYVKEISDQKISRELLDGVRRNIYTLKEIKQQDADTEMEMLDSTHQPLVKKPRQNDQDDDL